MPSVAEIKVAALEFAVTMSELAGLWTAPDGARERFRIGATRELIPRIDALRAELRDPMAVATGSTPQLREFSTDWAARFCLRRSSVPCPTSWWWCRMDRFMICRFI